MVGLCFCAVLFIRAFEYLMPYSQFYNFLSVFCFCFYFVLFFLWSLFSPFYHPYNENVEMLIVAHYRILSVHKWFSDTLMLRIPLIIVTFNLYLLFWVSLARSEAATCLEISFLQTLFWYYIGDKNLIAEVQSTGNWVHMEIG